MKYSLFILKRAAACSFLNKFRCFIEKPPWKIWIIISISAVTFVSPYSIPYRVTSTTITTITTTKLIIQRLNPFIEYSFSFLFFSCDADGGFSELWWSGYKKWTFFFLYISIPCTCTVHVYIHDVMVYSPCIDFSILFAHYFLFFCEEEQRKVKKMERSFLHNTFVKIRDYIHLCKVVMN